MITTTTKKVNKIEFISSKDIFFELHLGALNFNLPPMLNINWFFLLTSSNGGSTVKMFIPEAKRESFAFNKNSFYVIWKWIITLVYKFFLKNALYLVFNWFPLILRRWFWIRSPFVAVWSEFYRAASFVFFGLENKIFEIFENFAIFFEN